MKMSFDTPICALFGGSLIAAIIAVAPIARADQAVNVTLSDHGMDSMHMMLSTNQVTAGKITFNVINTSQDLVHELVIVKSDQPVETIAFNDKENEVTESAIKVVTELDDIDPGKSGILTVNLDPGTYVLLCNKTGHFKAGMVNRLTVVK